jgi:nitrogen regulatory protein P-II 1
VKEIKAVIRPFKLSGVLAELLEIEGMPGITVSEVKRYGMSCANDAEKESGNGLIDYVVKVKIEIVVPDSMAERAVAVIRSAAHTGNTGDGKIFVIPVDEAVVISTNENMPENG